MRSDAAELEVFSFQEIARAAGVDAEDVRWRVESLGLPVAGGSFVPFAAAVSLVRSIRAEAAGHPASRPLFAAPPPGRRETAVPAIVSGAVHAGLLAALVLAAGMTGRGAAVSPASGDAPQLVFLVQPGPGGGGGGGGMRQPSPSPAARLAGASAARSPVAVSRTPATSRQREAPAPPRRPDATRAVEPPRPEPADTLPPISAPVASAAADPSDEPGILAQTAHPHSSHGPGEGDGTGTGRGTGMGEGTGAGVGEGSLAGTGGGPYRPGSGITPPSLEREVTPIYTEEARRRGIEGDVVLEVVVRADGTVGTVRVVQGLGAGLDGRAVEAVRQWRFSPARRLGTPVDVLVEVAVEFKLR